MGRALGNRAPRGIGYLTTSPIVDPPTRERAAFLDEMRRLGYVIGENLLIEYRSAQRDPDALPQLVEELLKLEVALILAGGDVPTLVAKAATTRVPIVFTQSPDPVGNGLVRSLAMPGGNVTGLSYVAPDLAGKRMQLLHEALPVGTTGRDDLGRIGKERGGRGEGVDGRRRTAGPADRALIASKRPTR